MTDTLLWPSSALTASFHPLYIHNLLFPLSLLLLMRTRTGRIWEELFCLSSIFFLSVWDFTNLTTSNSNWNPKVHSSSCWRSCFFFWFFLTLWAIEWIITANFMMIYRWQIARHLCTCSAVVDISKEDETSGGVCKDSTHSREAELWC